MFPFFCIYSTSMKLRFLYLVLVLLLIVVGLASRRFPAIPEATGDALWAMMLFCCFRFVLLKADLRRVAVITLFASYLVEFSQLIRWPWLVQLRSTTLGHLLLGQGFLWSDLVAYTIGVVLVFLLCRRIERIKIG